MNVGKLQNSDLSKEIAFIDSKQYFNFNETI